MSVCRVCKRGEIFATQPMNIISNGAHLLLDSGALAFLKTRLFCNGYLQITAELLIAVPHVFVTELRGSGTR